jgi:serine/threonine protein kinase
MSLLSTEETERRAQEQVGRTLHEKYRLDALLGVGGMAAVYAATHRNGNRVAIKLLYPELARSADVLNRFIREGYAANRVGHPGAVRVLDDVRDTDGSVFLVMELLEGQSVDAVHAARDLKVAPADLLPWMNQLLDVLAAAHAQGIVHRDIKPENLFLTWGGVLKVLDFGIARMKSAPAASVTRTGNQFGTPPFMSPEQALGRMKDIDARSDIYSVGATMFYLLSGEDVHPAESANEMLVLAATKPARPVASVAPTLPEPIQAVVDRALAFDRDARWPDAKSMQAAIQKAYLDVFGETIPMLPPPPDSSASDVTGASRALRIRAQDPSSNPRMASAETQAVSSSPDLRLAHREIAATAPPTSALAPRGNHGRRWLFVAAGAVALALGAGSFFLRTEKSVAATKPDEAVAAPAAPSSATAPPAAASATPPPLATAPRPSVEAAPAPAPVASAAVPPAAVAPTRRKPRAPGAPRAVAPASTETSAFEHQ